MLPLVNIAPGLTTEVLAQMFWVCKKKVGKSYCFHSLKKYYRLLYFNGLHYGYQRALCSTDLAPE